MDGISSLTRPVEQQPIGAKSATQAYVHEKRANFLTGSWAHGGPSQYSHKINDLFVHLRDNPTFINPAVGAASPDKSAKICSLVAKASLAAPHATCAPTQPHKSVTVKDNDTVTLADSAYQSISAENASVATVSTTTECINRPRIWIRKIPGSDLLMFRKAGDKVITEEYRNVQLAVEKRLKDVLVASRQNARNLSTHLESVGRNYAEAKPKLIVLCAPDAEDAVRTFFQLDYVKTLLVLDSTLLEHIIVPQAPKNVSEEGHIRVLAQQTCEANRRTYCGTQITFASEFRQQKRSNLRLATFGGIVKVTFGSGETLLLGTSAGHAVDQLQRECSSVAAHGLERDQRGEDAFDLLDWVPIECAIGDVLLPEAFRGVSAGRATPSYDWTLFSVNATRLNQVIHQSRNEIDDTSDERVHSILKAEQPCFQDDVSDPVLLLGPAGGVRRGELSSVPTRIWLAGSEGFVDAYLLQLEDGNVREGDSGAWIVHAAAPDLYGHVVATNVFGDAYVMPALQTFENMRECLGATSVTLPNASDFLNTTSTENYETSGIAQKPMSIPSTESTKAPGSALASRRTEHGPKRWDQNFTKIQRLYAYNYVQSTLDFRKRTGTETDTTAIEVFLDSGSVPSVELDCIKQFCRQSDVPVKPSYIGTANNTRRAWVDHTHMNASTADYERQYRWMTARQLQCTLDNKATFEVEPYSLDHYRRLIYISQLDPEIIDSLAQSVSTLHIDTLRDAIGKHLTCQTSLGVTMSLGVKSFQLELHLPYLSLRQTSTPASRPSEPTQHYWTHLSFLKLTPESLRSPNCSGYMIREIKNSVVICGTDHFRWMGYAFSDRNLVDDHINDEGEHDDNDDNDEDDEDENDEMPFEDIFATDGNIQEYFHVVDDLIWDPRKYFLRCVQVRVAAVADEWRYLIQAVEVGAKDWLANLVYSDRDPQALGVALENYNKLQSLLFQMRQSLLAAIYAWDVFNSPGGDIGYFLDIRDKERNRLFLQLNQSFLEIRLQKKKLALLNNMCEKLFKTLTLRLKLESNNLNLESNKLILEANKLNRMTYDISLEVHRLNRHTAEIASASQEKVEIMSKTTRIHVQLLLVSFQTQS
ncbi:Nn.00g102800.m01.CDS01 [Neocucurbitaria sp. VM-36]